MSDLHLPEMPANGIHRAPGFDGDIERHAMPINMGGPVITSGESLAAPLVLPTTLPECRSFCVADPANLTGDPASAIANDGSDGPYLQGLGSKQPARITIGGKTWLHADQAFLQRMELTGISMGGLQYSYAMVLQMPTGIAFNRRAYDMGPADLAINATATGKILAHHDRDDHNSAVSDVQAFDTTLVITAGIDITQPGAGSAEVVHFFINGVDNHNPYSQNENTSSMVGSARYLFGQTITSTVYYRAHAFWHTLLTPAQFASQQTFFASLV